MLRDILNLVINYSSQISSSTSTSLVFDHEKESWRDIREMSQVLDDTMNTFFLSFTGDFQPTMFEAFWGKVVDSLMHVTRFQHPLYVVRKKGVQIWCDARIRKLLMDIYSSLLPSRPRSQRPYAQVREGYSSRILLALKGVGPVEVIAFGGGIGSSTKTKSIGVKSISEPSLHIASSGVAPLAKGRVSVVRGSGPKVVAPLHTSLSLTGEASSALEDPVKSIDESFLHTESSGLSSSAKGKDSVVWGPGTKLVAPLPVTRRAVDL